MKHNILSNESQQGNIQCLEVLIPKGGMALGGHHLHRLLSLYSLHNHPVDARPSVKHSEIFHFMVFDWNRTIRHLLENHRIPFKILRYFSPDTIYYETLVEDLSDSVQV